MKCLRFCRKLFQIFVLILAHKTKLAKQSHYQNMNKLLILMISFITHIEFFIIQNKSKYIANNYNWSFCQIIYVFPIFKAVQCIHTSLFSLLSKRLYLVLVHSSTAAKALATNSTFLPEVLHVFNPQTAKKSESCFA